MLFGQWRNTVVDPDIDYMCVISEDTWLLFGLQSYTTYLVAPTESAHSSRFGGPSRSTLNALAVCVPVAVLGVGSVLAFLLTKKTSRTDKREESCASATASQNTSEVVLTVAPGTPRRRAVGNTTDTGGSPRGLNAGGTGVGGAGSRQTSGSTTVRGSQTSSTHRIAAESRGRRREIKETLASMLVHSCTAAVTVRTEETCVICLEVMYEGEQVRMLGCGHRLHEICLTTWLLGKSNVKCPICKHTSAPSA